MTFWLARALVALLTLLATRGVGADEKSLHWDVLAVHARLDADGRLHVRERQVIVFNGDWNGGYRTFNLRFGQSLSLARIIRIDATGAEILLVAGDTDAIDHYDWTNSDTVRWRSRLPADPPFEHEKLTYELEYALSGILAARDDGTFLLDHDFAFPDREGVIERFELTVELDPVWEPIGDVNALHDVRNDQRLAPGYGVVRTLGLRYRGANAPAGVWRPLRTPLRAAAVAAMLIGLVLLGVRFHRRETSLGRFAPLPTAIDAGWLEEHVLAFLPEEVGAAWDDRVGPSEVAAVLARLVAEKKLATRVEEQRMLVFPLRTLHMRLLVPIEDLSGRDYEYALIHALFAGSTKTDTNAIRARYRKRGFDPSACIRTDLMKRVDRKLEAQDKAPAVDHRPTWGLLLAAVAMMMVGIYRDATTAPTLAFSLVTVVAFIPALAAARAWRRRMERLTLGAATFLLPALLPAVAAAANALRPGLFAPQAFRLNLPMLAGSALLALCGMAHVLNTAATRDGPRKLRRRQQFAAARRYFIDQLNQPQPNLRDEWFPYLVAFGLGREADRWFRRFAGETSSPRTRAASSSRSSSGASTGEPAAGRWTGGGGAFGGAGAGGSWIAAVGTVAAGVSQPSSSSRGGSSGGGSSGGGGGGGW